MVHSSDAGDDVIYTVPDEVTSWPATATTWLSRSSDGIEGDDGDDVVHRSGAGSDVIGGNAGNDMISVVPATTSSFGESSNNTIYGGAGDDESMGEAGNNMIYAGAGNDESWGSIPNDLGGTGNNMIYGGAGNDQSWGGHSSDTLFRQSGAELLHGGPGVDVIHSGSGIDALPQPGARPAATAHPDMARPTAAGVHPHAPFLDA